MSNTPIPEEQMTEQRPAPPRPDIFDRLMSLPGIRIFEPFYKKYKSILLYLFFGAVTTLVNLVVFLLLRRAVTLDEHTANIVAWCVAVLVAFFTNRRYVFFSAVGGRAMLYEFLRFVGSRIGTLLLEEAAIFVFVTWLSLYDLAVKLVVAVAVVILNYVFSRFLVFYKRSKTGKKEE